MKKRIEDMVGQIEDLRNDLYVLIEKDSYMENYNEILNVSEELDKAIINYIRKTYKTIKISKKG